MIVSYRTSIIFGNNPEQLPSPKPSSPDVEVDVKTEERASSNEDNPWKLYLYNDEVHTFEEVINQLIKALGCTRSKAEKIAKKAHSEGKALVIEGTFEECFEINTVLQEIQLVTEIKG